MSNQELPVASDNLTHDHPELKKISTNSNTQGPSHIEPKIDETTIFLFQNAINALRQLDKASLVELKSFVNPPAPVQKTLEATCILLGEKGDWGTARQLLQETAKLIVRILQFQPQNISENVYNQVKEITQDENMNPELVKQSSNAAYALCSWVRCALSTHRVLKVEGARDLMKTNDVITMGNTVSEKPPLIKLDLEEQKAEEKSENQSGPLSSRAENPSLEARIQLAKHGLKCLQKSDLVMIQNSAKQSMELEKTMSIVCALLGEKAGWSTAKDLLRDPAGLFDRMFGLDPHTITEPTYQKVLLMLDDPTIQPEKVKQSSSAAFSVYQWIKNIIQLYESYRKPVVPTSQDNEEPKPSSSPRKVNTPRLIERASPALRTQGSLGRDKSPSLARNRGDRDKSPSLVKNREDNGGLGRILKTEGAEPQEVVQETPTVEEQLRIAQEGLRHLKVKDLDELSRYTNPPVPVEETLIVAFTLLGYKGDWKTIKPLLRDSKGFLSKMLDFDPHNIPEQAYAEVKEKLKDDTLRVEVVKNSSFPAYSICKWVHSVMALSEVYRNQKFYRGLYYRSEGEKIKAAGLFDTEEQKAEVEEVQTKKPDQNDELKDVKDRIRQLNKENLMELKSFLNPPVSVKKTFEAVGLLIGEEGSWSSARLLLKDAARLIVKVFGVIVEEIPEQIYLEVKEITASPHMNPEVVKETSVAAYAFCEWVHKVVEIYEDRKNGKAVKIENNQILEERNEVQETKAVKITISVTGPDGEIQTLNEEPTKQENVNVEVQESQNTNEEEVVIFEGDNKQESQMKEKTGTEEVEGSKKAENHEEQKQEIGQNDLNDKPQANEENPRNNNENIFEPLRLLTKEDITVLKSYVKPPLAVERTLSVLCLLFEEKGDWQAAKILLKDPQAFLRKLQAFSIESLSEKTYAKVKQMLQEGNDLNPEAVRASSTAAYAICQWLHAVVTRYPLVKAQSN